MENEFIPEKKKTNILTCLVIGFMVVALLFTAVQSFQINSLEREIVQGSLTGLSVSAASTPTQPRSAPQMVGGC